MLSNRYQMELAITSIPLSMRVLATFFVIPTRKFHIYFNYLSYKNIEKIDFYYLKLYKLYRFLNYYCHFIVIKKFELQNSRNLSINTNN